MTNNVQCLYRFKYNAMRWWGTESKWTNEREEKTISFLLLLRLLLLLLPPMGYIFELCFRSALFKSESHHEWMNQMRLCLLNVCISFVKVCVMYSNKSSNEAWNQNGFIDKTFFLLLFFFLLLILCVWVSVVLQFHIEND